MEGDADDDDDATKGERSRCTLQLHAATCVYLGETRRHDALRRHPSIACGEWAKSDGPEVRGGAIPAGRCKGRGFDGFDGRLLDVSL